MEESILREFAKSPLFDKEVSVNNPDASVEAKALAFDIMRKMLSSEGDEELVLWKIANYWPMRLEAYLEDRDSLQDERRNLMKSLYGGTE